MKYCVTVERTGCVFVEAENEEQAMYIADHLTTDTINWSEDWEPTDCTEDDSLADGEYITEPDFE